MPEGTIERRTQSKLLYIGFDDGFHALYSDLTFAGVMIIGFSERGTNTLIARTEDSHHKYEIRKIATNTWSFYSQNPLSIDFLIEMAELTIQEPLEEKPSTNS